MGLKFVYPEFLFALSLLSIPVIIHLFNFRRFKRILFTNVRFLKEVKEETTSRSKLKHLLVLLSRLLAVAFLVLAFSQPYIPINKSTKITNNRALSLYLDNSFSMEANGREGTLFQEAKNQAIKISNAFQTSDQFQLLTNDFEPAHQRLVNRDEFLNLLDQVKISPSLKTVSEVISRQREALNHSGAREKSSFLLSDFQQTITDIMSCRMDSNIKTTLIPVKSEIRNNLFIDSCWFSSPLIQLNVPCELNIRINNAGQNPVENIPLKLIINGVQKSLTSLVVDANGTTNVKMSFSVTSSGWQQAQISLTDYPITFDDYYYFSFEVASNLKVISINNDVPSNYLKALFGSNNYFEFNNIKVSLIDYSLFNKSQLIILNELKEISSGLADELKKFVGNGGHLVIFPDTALDLQSYLDFLLSVKADAYATVNENEDKVARIDTKSDLFADVFEKIPENIDLPVVKKYFEMTTSTQSNKEVLMKLQGGAAFLNRYSFGKGKVYAFSVPLTPGYSGLARHAIFVPVLYKIALLSRISPSLSYEVGKNNAVNIANTTVGGEDVFHLINEKEKIDIIPAHRNDPTGTVIDIPVEINIAGNYNLTFKNNLVSVISLNYNRKESEMATYSTESLNGQIESAHLINFNTIAPDTPDLTKSLLEINEGKRLWMICIIFALIFLVAEILLLKLLK